jgi:hypothetical protein
MTGEPAPDTRERDAPTFRLAFGYRYDCDSSTFARASSIRANAEATS